MDIWRGKTLKEYCDQDCLKESSGTQELELISSITLMYNSHGGFDKYKRKFEQYFRQLKEAEHPRDCSTTKNICATKIFLETIHQLRKKETQLNKSEQTRLKEYIHANQKCRNSIGSRKGNNYNTKNEKKKRQNDPCIQK